jgi:hypothetical protein
VKKSTTQGAPCVQTKIFFLEYPFLVHFVTKVCLYFLNQHKILRLLIPMKDILCKQMLDPYTCIMNYRKCCDQRSATNCHWVKQLFFVYFHYVLKVCTGNKSKGYFCPSFNINPAYWTRSGSISSLTSKGCSFYSTVLYRISEQNRWLDIPFPHNCVGYPKEFTILNIKKKSLLLFSAIGKRFWVPSKTF